MYNHEHNARAKAHRDRFAVHQLFLFASPLFSQDAPAKVELFPEVKHKKTVPLREMKSVTPHTSSSDPDEDAGVGSRTARVATGGGGTDRVLIPVTKKQLLAPVKRYARVKFRRSRC